MNESVSQELVVSMARVIKEKRLSLGYTLEELANISGLHRTTIGLYERAERCPTIDAAFQISKALNITLSELIMSAEEDSKPSISQDFIKRRSVPRENLRNEDLLRQISGLSSDSIRDAILSCYKTLDTIDNQLISNGVEPMSKLVELANLSSMIGNLIGAALAESSNGLYERNRPHAYPDLIPKVEGYNDFEIKVALETNKPKGHLPKAGNYITFRYVLCDEFGQYTKGKENRGSRVFIWEVKVGKILIEDFSISNTAGDSGKTAVIKTPIFNDMHLVYYDPQILPYSQKNDGDYPGFN